MIDTSQMEKQENLTHVVDIWYVSDPTTEIADGILTVLHWRLGCGWQIFVAALVSYH